MSKRICIAILAIAFCAHSPRGFAAEKSAAFEGTISVTLTRGGNATQFLFTRKGNQLRVEDTDKSRPEPVNIVDLAAKQMTIVFPHNSTFTHVDLTNTTPPNPNTSRSEVATGIRTPPPGGMPVLPNPAMMPAIPGPFGSPELKKTDKTKTIQGFDCTLYTASERMETLEIWATSDASLFPFRLLQRDHGLRRFGPQMLEETWPELLQRKSLFPMEATLRMEGMNQKRLSFKVDKIDSPSRTGSSKIDNDALFKAPENYQEIEVPRF